MQAEVIRTLCRGWLNSAIHLRRIPLPHSDAPPEVYHRARMNARAQLDSLEEILGQAITLRGELRIEVGRLDDIVRDEWDNEAVRRVGAGRNAEFSSAPERAAFCNLHVRVQRNEYRAAKALLDEVSTTVDRLWLKFNGLRGTKGDMADELKYLTFESHLERT